MLMTIDRQVWNDKYMHMLILFPFFNVFFLKLLSGCFSLLKMYLCLKNVLGCFRCPQFSKLDGNCHLERDILNPCCMKRVCDPTKITVAPSPGVTPKPVPRESHLETQFSLKQSKLLVAYSMSIKYKWQIQKNWGVLQVSGIILNSAMYIQSLQYEFSVKDDFFQK